MLVLSRKNNEAVVVGNQVVVTVVEIRGDRVKLGFTAPDNVTIYREEVFRRICAESPTEVCPPGDEESPYFAECA